MKNKVKILLQTTIPYIEDDWNINRFSLLHDHLSLLQDNEGQRLYEVVARDRQVNSNGDDELLSRLGESDFDELWLFAVDTGDGLTKTDCEGITRFRQRGGGILATRDHQDLGSSLCTLGGVGRAHFFHSNHQDPDTTRNQIDDQDTPTISWPNYHSGSNGNYQGVTPLEPVHELMLNPKSTSGVIEYFPAHPHEGGVGLPDDDKHARVVATGLSIVTKRPFNLMVALDRCGDDNGNRLGRAVAESSFHHFVDYNWDLSKGCPTFLLEPPGDQIRKDPSKLADIKTYVANLAAWLGPGS